jgi:transcriptional regulator with XRE-family HTH domain
MTIDQTIKKLRLTLCLEQQEFGMLIGVTKSSVCNYEQGNRKPRLPVIRKMMELAKKNKIKITLEDFLNYRE